MTGLILVAATLLGGCDSMSFGQQERVVGSGKKANESRTVGSYRKVAFSLPATVDIKVGRQSKIEISGDDNLLSLIETKVEKGTLRIGFKERVSVSTKTPMKVTFTAPDLEAFSLAGSGDATVTGVDEGSFALDLAGSGKVKITGSAPTLTVSIAGSGDIDLAGLRSRKADVDIAGSGKIQLNASDEIKASIAGSGDIIYRGNPTIQRSIVGSGSIRKAN